jgi:hypothetical protein
MDISLCRQLLLTVARRLLLRSLASRFLKCILLLLTRLRRALLGRKPSARKGASKRRPSQTPFDQQLTVDDLGTCEAVCPCNEPTSRETCENEFRAVFSHDGSTGSNSPICPSPMPTPYTVTYHARCNTVPPIQGSQSLARVCP